MQIRKWSVMLSQTVVALSLLFVTDQLSAQDVETNKHLPSKEVRTAGPPESRPRPEPNLVRELRREQFAEKIKLTDDQLTHLNKLDTERTDAFRERFLVGGSRQDIANRQSEMATISKTYEDKMLEILTLGQKAIWQAHKQEVIASRAAESVPQGSSDRQSQPLLLREIRDEKFVAKIKLTDEQKIRLKELNSERNDVLRELIRPREGPREDSNLREKTSKIAKTYEDKALDVLTPEQKVIWEAHKQEVNVPGNRGSAWPENPDRARIRALEVEVESLKADVARLKAAMEAKPATKAP